MSDLPPREARDVPAAARRRAEFTRQVAKAASSRKVKEFWQSAILCIARVARRKREARVEVAWMSIDEVRWRCTSCKDEGVVNGVLASDADLSGYLPKKRVIWGIDGAERELLLSAVQDIPPLKAVIMRGRPHAEISEMLLIEASIEELDNMYTLVEELTDVTRSAARRDLLDGLRASLCTSMDGF